MVFFSATSPDQVTDLPAFNDFQMAVQAALEGHSDEKELGRLVMVFFMSLRIVLVFFFLVPALALHWTGRKTK